jgi:DNA-binding CsgD family transcriptional regulator
MYQRYLERINSIAEFLSRSPHPDQVIDFLSGNISPLDEVVVAYRGVVDPDGVIRCENIQGFSKHEVLTKARFLLSDQRPISIAARTQKTIWAHISNVKEEFPDFVHFDKYTPWESMVAIPVTLIRVYGFSFPSDLRLSEGINPYLEAVASLLKVYESALDIKNSLGSKTYLEESEVQPLSERQTKILECLKTGMTNKEIAELIEYSESLVRHETMIIYKKLRVEGRHQLRERV